MEESFNLQNPSAPQDRLIVALDVATKEEAIIIVDKLQGRVSFFKVGYQLFLAAGMSFVKELIDKGKRVFLDLKMDDVEETITLAVREITKQGVHFLTLHGNGATARAAIRGRGDRRQPKILSVTLLTSLDSQDLMDLGILGPKGRFQNLDQYVHWRAEQVMKAECDGLIAAGPSVARLRVLHPNAIIVTPGVRPAGTTTDDHKRPTTPRAAIASGASYLVVGRPIRDAHDPRRMADAIIEEIGQGLGEQRQHLQLVQ